MSIHLTIIQRQRERQHQAGKGFKVTPSPAFVRMPWVCLCHFKSFWVVRPKILNESTTSTGDPSMKSGVKDGFSFENWTISSLHLVTLSFM